MNILISVERDTLTKYCVMLTSLFENNEKTIDVFCIEKEKNKEVELTLNAIVEKYSKKIEYIYGKFFPSNSGFSLINIKVYEILSAPVFLPHDLDRILYIKEDVIIDGDLEGFYNIDFGGKTLLVRGQTSEKIQGKNYRIGARPELGQLFDERVIVLNLKRLREIFQPKWIQESFFEEISTKNISSQGMLNILFKNEAKYVTEDKYNYRYSICEELAKARRMLDVKNAIIVCYEKRDYYHIGKVTMPWDLYLSNLEIEKLKMDGTIKSKFDLCQAEETCIYMIDLWWKYAEKTFQYNTLKSEMEVSKIKILSLVKKTEEQVIHYQKTKEVFKNLSVEKRIAYKNELTQITYEELEQYIDSIDKFSAVNTMKNLFQINCRNLLAKEKIKVGFLAYSASEWQCERLYEMFANDIHFEPYIIIVFYNQGSKKAVYENYENTVEYFNSKKNKHRLILTETIENEVEYMDMFDILIYMTPFEMLPTNINIKRRKINQLCIHIPYAYYLVSKDDARYGGEYYDKSIFKLAWHYFASCQLDKEITSARQRLMGYNIVVSGFPKLDDLIKKTFHIRNNLWKLNNRVGLKIIWAPHFNMLKGMNGTFNENYIWMYEFAKNTPDISWIVKPHPRMKIGAIEAGVFNSDMDYEDYIKRWNDLDNARVIESGDYYDIFDSSDAMILDSVSFLAEYQFTGKPLLWLYPKEQREMSELGSKLLSVLYKARGNDFLKIEKFVNECKLKKDRMYNERKAFFKKYLDYFEINKKTASECIYNLICKEIGWDREF